MHQQQSCIYISVQTAYTHTMYAYTHHGVYIHTYIHTKYLSCSASTSGPTITGNIGEEGGTPISAAKVRTFFHILTRSCGVSVAVLMAAMDAAMAGTCGGRMLCLLVCKCVVLCICAHMHAWVL